MESQEMSSQICMARPVLIPRVERDNSTNLEHLEKLLLQAFYRPDLQAIRIALATIQAHRLDIGDLAWLFVVALPGCGKTTASIMGASHLQAVVMIGDLTENTFLSGFYCHSQPGMLEKLGTVHQEGRTFSTHGNAV